MINSSKRTCCVYAEKIARTRRFSLVHPEVLLAYFDEYTKMFYINDEGKNTWEKRCVNLLLNSCYSESITILFLILQAICPKALGMVNNGILIAMFKQRLIELLYVLTSTSTNLCCVIGI